MPKLKRASSSLTASRAKKRKKLRIPERLQQDSDSDENDLRQETDENDVRQETDENNVQQETDEMMLGRK